MAPREITYAEAINEAQLQEMEQDEKVILFGENVSSSWRPATKGLKERFGRERVRDAPITETAFIGAGVGAAIAGMRKRSYPQRMPVRTIRSYARDEGGCTK